MSAPPRRKKRQSPNTLPDRVFKPVVQRLNELVRIHSTQWPDGVDPKKLILPIPHGPTMRAYAAGVRTADLYQNMVRLRDFLEIEKTC